jgi:hypothetical protein
VTGAPSSGKALALDTPIPTPTGWTTMGDLQVGDIIYDDKGEPCTVTFTTPIQHDRKCYELSFDNGIKIVADEDHRWFTTTRASRRSAQRATKRQAYLLDENKLPVEYNDQSHKRVMAGVVNTKDIFETLKAEDHFNHQIPISRPIIGRDVDLPIGPYLLGLWLGDGCSSSARLFCGKQDIQELRDNLAAEDIPFKETLSSRGVWTIQLSEGHSGLMKEKIRYKLRNLDLLKNKHIPMLYQRASVTSRIELLKGLMDTDGTISKVGECHFEVTNERLALDVHQLLSGLGINASYHVGSCSLYGKDCGERYRIHFTTSKKVFRLSRKLEKLNSSVRKSEAITIMDCKRVSSVPVRCITVDSPSHLFLCSHGFIPTHNTFNVMKVIGELGLREGVDFLKKKGSMTAPTLYRMLIEQTNGMIILDDCDSVWEDSNGVNMLKGALDTEAIREIDNDKTGTINTAVMTFDERQEYTMRLSRVLRRKPDDTDGDYFAQFIPSKIMRQLEKAANDDDEGDEPASDVDAEDGPPAAAPTGRRGSVKDGILEFVSQPTRYPNKIVFNGRMIFISNLNQDELDPAVVSRAFIQHLEFSDLEMLDYIAKVQNHMITPHITDEQKAEVIEYIRTIWTTGKLNRTINFRLALASFDMRLMDNWQDLINDL